MALETQSTVFPDSCTRLTKHNLTRVTKYKRNFNKHEPKIVFQVKVFLKCVDDGGGDGGDGGDDGGDGGNDGGDGRMVRSNVKKFIRVRAPIQVESSALRF